MIPITEETDLKMKWTKLHLAVVLAQESVCLLSSLPLQLQNKSLSKTQMPATEPLGLFIWWNIHQVENKPALG